MPGNEDFVYQGVELGIIDVRGDGTVWRIGQRHKTKRGFVVLPISVPRPVRYLDKDGYLIVTLMLDNERKLAKVHRLVWRHFRGVIPVGLTINHKNGNKIDNRIDNLELMTVVENLKHASRVLDAFSRGEQHYRSRLTTEQVSEVRKRLAQGETQGEVASFFGVSRPSISNIATGHTRRRG